ncbi:hypothetical protein [Bacteroides sp.]|uniref:hypothetical protein n=1 Tax=Bacteroides sp. TaxID=29523 RepID=UPI002637F427|nr:hypothetical protein [Bacteroides sp.]MDD3038151.1 hypothetical protein [Bacteroides sp.]
MDQFKGELIALIDLFIKDRIDIVKYQSKECKNQQLRISLNNRRANEQRVKVIDNRENSGMKIATNLNGHNICQFVKEDMYEGDEKRKFKLVKRMLIEEARAGYTEKNALDILEGVSLDNMKVIFRWTDDYIKVMPWSLYALDILKNPPKYGKGKTEGGVAEEQWGETNLSGILKTTGFTSCLGIACRTKSKLKVIHLVLSNEYGFIVEKPILEDAKKYINNIMIDAIEIVLFGCIDYWIDYLPSLGLSSFVHTDEKFKGEGNSECWSIFLHENKIDVAQTKV